VPGNFIDNTGLEQPPPHVANQSMLPMNHPARLKTSSHPWFQLFTGLLATVCLQALAESEHSGGWRLADASSPYLRMHADNPVDWYPWGEEAFARARREHKPLFISVGYFTCHWCHVMERESFMNPAVAALLNKHFISIKVDREQRPDIDSAYMSFVMLTRGAGGWPMTVFATPEGYPFTGGTYFPPVSRDGHIGLQELLGRIQKLWDEDPQQVEAAASAAVLQIRELSRSQSSPGNHIDARLPDKARQDFRHRYDALAGGFGDAPKFPQAPQLLFLLQSPEEQDRDMALRTLDAMADGGIHDQLAGGFHRYATDPQWRVPHFEKMLYDQALNARAYLAAWHVSGQPRYSKVARGILDFALAQLRAADGSFYAAFAADSLPATAAQHAEEGAYYTWDQDQWQAALPDAALRRLAAARYGVRDTGNVAADPGGELTGRNVLYIAATLPALAERQSLSLEHLNDMLNRADRLLLAARAGRPAVPVDDKLVAAWNGYMITALAEAGRLLKEPRYLAAARHSADAVLARLYDPQTRRLYRDFSAGSRGTPGFASDYAALGEALLALYEASDEPRWLALADALTETQIALFWDDKAGGFFDSPADTRVWLRDKQADDGVEPGVNSLSIGNLLKLARLTDSPALLERARRTAGWSGSRFADTPGSMAYALIQWPTLMAVNAAPHSDAASTAATPPRQ